MCLFLRPALFDRQMTLSHCFYNTLVEVPLIRSEALLTFSDMKGLAGVR